MFFVSLQLTSSSSSSLISFQLDVLGVTVLGTDLEGLSGKGKDFAKAISIYLRESNNPLRMSHPLFEKLSFLQCNKDLSFSLACLKERIGALIAQKKLLREGKKTEALDLFDLLIDALSDSDPDQRVTESSVFGNVLLMILAGHETTSNALTWCFYHLGQYPELQERVYQEIQEVLHGADPTIESVKDLQYLNRFMKENMRVIPPVGLVPGRRCGDDLPLPGTNYTIPKGAFVSYSIWAIHRDPKHWPEPEKFDPDRFLPENSKNRNLHAYMPFSFGKRMCIGHQFSLIEQQFLLCIILQRFKVIPVTKAYKLKVGIVLAPEELLVRFESRNPQ